MFEVVENARPLAAKFDAEVVLNALPWFWLRKNEAEVVEKVVRKHRCQPQC